MRRRKLRFFLPLILTAVFSTAAVFTQSEGDAKGHALVRILSAADLDRLDRFGAHILNVGSGWAEVAVDEDGLAQLRVEGFSVHPVPDRAHQQYLQRLAAGEIGGKAADTYYTLDTMAADLQAVAAAHPTICRLLTAGNSVRGRPLYVMKITLDPDTPNTRAGFKYVGSMHGDEPVGMEMLMRLIHLLTESYGSDTRITNIVNNLEIYIMPLMNPDGYGMMGSPQRGNAHGVDLNRDFPDQFDDPNNTTSGRQPETAAVMNFFAAHGTAISANFHTGALVVNYPWDNSTKPSGTYSTCPDDDVFIHMSEVYSSHNLPMWNSASFHHGITNGNDWYAVSGGMQDWAYSWMGSMEVTIELSDDFFPPASRLATLWEENRESLLAYLEEALHGIWGFVTDADTGLPLTATIVPVGRSVPAITDPTTGDYHRRLLPGTYSLYFGAEGYDTLLVTGVVVPAGSPVRVDAQLSLHHGPTQGDVNRDGFIDALDSVLLASWFTGNQMDAAIDRKEADLDKNHFIQPADLVLLLIALL